MRTAILAILAFTGLGATATELEINDPSSIRRFELALPQAFYQQAEDGTFSWLPGTVVVSVTGPGKPAASWVVIDGRPEILRLKVDDRQLSWQPPKLTGSLNYDGQKDESTISLQLDLTCTGTDVGGSYTVHHQRRRRGSLKDVADGKGQISGKLLSRDDLAAHAIADGRAWPGWRGGTHAGVATAEGDDVELIDDLRDARFLWKTDTATPMPGHTDSRLLGGYGEVTVAEDRVFMNWYIGHGDVYPGGKSFEQMVAKVKADVEKAQGRGLNAYIQQYFKGSVEAYVKAKMPIAATDVVDCYDARTGVTLWRARFPGKGINWQNCDGPHFYPTYEDGRITCVGSAGAIYCLEAATGKLLWEGSLPGRPAAEEQVKAMLAAGGGNRLGSSRYIVNKPMAIDGVLVTAEAGLYGLDAKTGKQLWGPIKEVNNGNPRPWRHEGKTYVLCRTDYGRGDNGGGLVCVDPKTGQLLWHDGRLPGGSKEYANDDEYLFSCGIGVGKGGKQGGIIYEPTCFKLSTTGLEKIWSLPEITKEPRMASAAIYQGHVYTIWDGVWAEGEKRQTFIVCIEAATGKVMGKVPLSGPGGYTQKTWQGLVAGNGRLFYINGQSGPKNLWMRTGPEFGLLEENPATAWKIPGTYQVLSPVLCDGRLFVREKGDAADDEGSRIYCFDLRKKSEVIPPITLHGLTRCMVRWCLLLVVCVVIAGQLGAAEIRAVDTGPKERFLVFLLIGQSNMAGRATITDADHTMPERLFLLDDTGAWQAASHPFNQFSSIRKPGKKQGLNFGYSFAKALLAAHPELSIGLVVNARGTTKLTDWRRGAKSGYYAAALKRMHIAATSGTIAGVLWHQGEHSSTDTEYVAHLRDWVITPLREDLALPALPFVAGQLMPFHEKVDETKMPKAARHRAFNERLLALPKIVAATGVASSAGLAHGGADPHFGREAVLTFGERYAAVMLKLLAKDTAPLSTPPQDKERPPQPQGKPARTIHEPSAASAVSPHLRLLSTSGWSFACACSQLGTTAVRGDIAPLGSDLFGDYAGPGHSGRAMTGVPLGAMDHAPRPAPQRGAVSQPGENRRVDVPHKHLSAP